MATWKLNGYVLQGVLGRGGSGEVWHALEAATGLSVALKRVQIAGSEQLRHALAEGALLAQLDHPNLIRVREVVSGRDWVVLVLDLADGGSLADLLRRRGRLTPGEVVAALAPIGAAVAHLHAAGIVHGDVSSGNILFSRAGLPLLADLGIARVLGDDVPIQTTAAYVDPAVAAGCVPGVASDVFALGAVAVHALSGEPLWGAGSPAQMLRRAADGLSDDPDELSRRMPGVSPAVLAVLSRALAREVAARCTAAEFALDLRYSCEPAPIELRAGRPAPPVPGRLAGSSPPAGFTWSPAPRASSSRAVAGRHRLDGRTSSAHQPGRQSFDRPGVPISPGDRPDDRGLLTHGARVAPPPVRPAGRVRAGKRWWRRRWRLTVLTAALVTVGVTVGALVAQSIWLSGDRTPAGRGASAPPAGRPPSPAAPANELAAALVTLRALDAVRERAFAERSPGLLSQIYPPGPLRDADTALLLRSVPIGCGLNGVRTGYEGLAANAITTGGTVVTVRASLPGSSLACPGAPPRAVPGVAPTVLRIALIRTGSGYLISTQRLLTS
jgi:serine/threonine protein kinase